MNIFQARILNDGDIINKSNSRQAQTMICQRIMESTRPIFTCVHKSLFAFHLLLPFILKSSANPALREQRKVTLSLFIKSSHFSDLSERTILTTSFVLLHHEIQEQKPLNHLLKHTISFSFSLKYGHSHIHQASNHQHLQPPYIHHLHTQQSKQPHLPTYPKTTILHPTTTTIDIPPTMSPTTTPSRCTHPPIHALTCPTCIFAHNTARERLIRAYYDPIIADLESRIAIAVEKLWIGENEFLKERLVGAREDLEGLKARREGEVGGVWGR